jgi:hypothetical protein
MLEEQAYTGLTTSAHLGLGLPAIFLISRVLPDARADFFGSCLAE